MIKSSGKKLIALLLMVLMITTVSSELVFAVSNVNDLQEEFISKVEQSIYYHEYSPFMTSSTPLIVNSTFDENSNMTGYIAQYEVNLVEESIPNEDIPVMLETNVTSLLTFIYNIEMEIMDAYLIDYRYIDTEEKIYVTHLNSSEVDSIPINAVGNEKLSDLSEEIREAKTQFKEEFEKELDKRSNEITIMTCWTWICYEYKSGGGHWDGDCSTALGVACTLISYINQLGGAVCAGGILIACYVPKYKICVRGEYQPFCE